VFRLSFLVLALITITLVLLVTAMVLSVVLIVATCRSPPAGAMRRELQSNVVAKDWADDAQLFYDETPHIKPFNAGNPFPHVGND
jgi:hypothetical protein